MTAVAPVACGADQDEEEDVDGEGVEDSDDGAFRDGNTWSLQLTFTHRLRNSKDLLTCLCRDLQKHSLFFIICQMKASLL